MSAAVLITGAPGAGKSSVLEALGALLEIEGVEHGAIESEELTRGFPALSNELLIPQLEDVLVRQREAGRELFLIAFTAETAAQLRAVRAAARAERVLVVCLAADAGLLDRRLEEREPDSWPGKSGLIDHARRLAPLVSALGGVDVVLETEGREPVDVAREVLAEMRASGLEDAGRSS